MKVTEPEWNGRLEERRSWKSRRSPYRWRALFHSTQIEALLRFRQTSKGGRH